MMIDSWMAHQWSCSIPSEEGFKMVQANQGDDALLSPVG